MAILSNVPPFTVGADSRFDFVDGWSILPFSVIDTLAGADIIYGSGGYYGILNEGELYTSEGSDVITGIGSGYGILNEYYYYGNPVVINTGSGDDSIIGYGDYYGIVNYGTIYTDLGNDLISGSGDTDGILNYGTIVTGSGHDLIDALIGGFGGPGAVAMGNGNDTLMGFGTGSFSGGGGTRDRLLLGDEGIYTVILSSGVGTITLGATSMTIGQFEWIGGASGGLFAIPFSTTSSPPTALTISGGVATSFV